MAAHASCSDQAKVGDATNNIFWLDPWSKDGQKIAAQVRPYTHDLRMHAEAALTLIAQARAAAGPTPQRHPASVTSAPTRTLYDAAKFGAASSALREPDAVDAMELGARRMDFIGLKFQLADEMAAGYARALAASTSPPTARSAPPSAASSATSTASTAASRTSATATPSPRPVRVGVAALQPALLAAQRAASSTTTRRPLARTRRQGTQRAAPVGRLEDPALSRRSRHSPRPSHNACTGYGASIDSHQPAA